MFTTETFNRALVAPPKGEQYRNDYVYLRSRRRSGRRRTERALVINLESYFDHVGRLADDDLFVACHLLRQIITLLFQVLSNPDQDWSQLLVDVTYRMYDSFVLLGKLIRDGALLVPTHLVMNGYPQVHVDQADRSHTVRPHHVAERVPYGEMLAGYGTAWRGPVGNLEKHSIGRVEEYMACVFRDRSSSLGSAEFVFFKLSDLLEMFKDLQQRIP